MKHKPNVLCFADTTHQAGAVRDHIRAVTASSELFNWHIINPLELKTIEKVDFGLFDAIGVHYSVKLHGFYYLSYALKRKIQAFNGFKFVLLQDEYQKVNQTEALLAQLGIDVLFTLVRSDLIDTAYPDNRLKTLKKVQVLTGYVDDELLTLNSPPIASRPIDVSYRTRHCEYRLGKLAQDKTVLAERFPKYASTRQLTLDVSAEESDRVYGDAWFQLLKDSKVVLGTESGASIWDRDGEVSKKIRQYLRKNRKATFQAVHEAVLKPYEGNLLYSAISPRVFEAAAAKACLVMFEGEYSGVCKPDVHYIPLKKDFSNISEVLDKIEDDNYLQTIVDKAYQDLILSRDYAMDKLSEVIAFELTEAFHQRALVRTESKIITEAIEKVGVRYQLLNRFRCFYTELVFVFAQFFKLVFEPSETWQMKLGLFTKGAKRYVSYLSPRLKKSAG